MKTTQQIINDELTNLKKYPNTIRKINLLKIYSLVGNPNTGKTTVLNELISNLSKKTSKWVKIDIKNMEDFKKTKYSIQGDAKDSIAIFRNQDTQKKLGIVTPGDSVSIVSEGLQYLVDNEVDFAIIASHHKCFNGFVSKLNPLSIGTTILDVAKSHHSKKTDRYVEHFESCIDGL